MEKYIRILIVFGVFLTSSCNKFLEVEPLDFIEPEAYYETEEQLNFALAGVYDLLASNALYGTAFTNRMGLEADEGVYRNPDLTIGPQVYNLSSGNNYVANLWRTCYDGIGRANILLANVHKNEDISHEYRRRVEGETLFLRAYYYYLLVINFGDVPLVLEPVEGSYGLQVPRTPVREVYEQIIDDMELAETVVARIEDIGFGGRVSKSAVRGILARVCLHMAGFPVRDVSKYEDARFWADKVINDAGAGHELNPDYKDIFIKLARDEYDIKESIWEVEYWAEITGPYRELSALGGWLGIPTSNNTVIGNSWGFIQVNGTLWYKYPDVMDRSSSDLRREWNIPRFTYDADGQKVWNLATSPSSSFWTKYPGKYRREHELTQPRANYNSGINYPLLRFSDILLMWAEADNEIEGTPSQRAIDYVNMVRRRGYGNGTTIKSIVIDNPGTDYTNPVVRITGGGGKDAVVEARAATTGNRGVNSIIIVDRGIGYTSPPTVEIIGDTGSGATVNVTLSDETEGELTSFQTSHKVIFREIIQEERARELCFEGLRKHDLIRWGIFLPVMKNVLDEMNRELSANTHFKTQAYRNVAERHLLFPIPAREMTLNRLLTQNPNW